VNVHIENNPVVLNNFQGNINLNIGLNNNNNHQGNLHLNLNEGSNIQGNINLASGSNTQGNSNVEIDNVNSVMEESPHQDVFEFLDDYCQEFDY
jgi:hypothetical protein